MPIENYVTTDYVANYAEANRRRPTHIIGPLITSYVGVYYPGDFGTYFVPFATQLLRFIGYHGNEEATAKALFALLDHNAGPLPRDGAPTALEQEKAAADFIFEEPSPHFERATWRLEIHREFAAITLFVGLDIIDEGDSIRYRIAKRGGCGDSSPPIPKRRAHHRSVLAALYKRFPKTMDLQFQPLEEILRAFWHDRTERRSPRVFARLYGAIVPWTALAVGLTNKELPRFPDRASGGFRQDRAQPFAQPTDRFLQAIWKRGVTRHLLGGKDHDTVACFVQNGHGLYVSDLGHRENASDRSTLKYLLLYSDQDDVRRGPVAPLTVRSKDLNEGGARPPSQFSWRLSRLVGRLHDLGGTRLAALRNQHSMMRFSQKLRAIEELLQSGEPLDHERVVDAEHQLQTAARTVGEPIAARSYRTAYYLDNLRSLSDDLGVVTLPSYQPYTHFVRRRLFGQMRYLSGIGARHERLLERIQTIYNSHVAREILSIQRLADIVGAIIMIYYSMMIVDHGFEAYERAEPFLETLCDHPRLWPIPLPSTSEAARGFWVLFAGIAFYLAVGGRVRDVAQTWRPDWMLPPWLRPDRRSETHDARLRRSRRQRPLQYVFAHIVLAPYLMLRWMTSPWTWWPTFRRHWRAWRAWRSASRRATNRPRPRLTDGPSGTAYGA